MRESVGGGLRLSLACVLGALNGCAMVPPKSFLDPTRVGRFPLPDQYHETSIRRVLTPLDGEPGIAGATEPAPEDLVPTLEQYRIGIADGIQISIEQFLEGDRLYQVAREVDPTGYIRLPLIGSLKVVGLTEAELEQVLEMRVKEMGILTQPIVQVFVANRRDLYFSVIGSVRQPGPYSLSRPDLRLMDVLGLIGDVGAEAKRMYVIRRTEPEPLPREPPPAKPAPEELLIPPPEEPGSGSAGGASGLTGPSSVFERLEAAARPLMHAPTPTEPAGGIGPRVKAQPTSSQPPPTRQELAEVLEPPAQSTQPAARPPDRTFPPLIFDPQTGTMREAPQEATQPAPSPTEAAGPVEAPQKPFRWEDVPEYELSQRVIEIDVPALKSGDPRYNIVIRNRDLINVPIDTGVFYVMGEVNRPGVFGFNGREITVKQALAIVGGFAALAWPSRCEIIRREQGTDKQITIPVNLDLIFAGVQEDFLLRDGDILNVGTDIVAPFLFVIRNSFRFTYGFGFVYDRNFADKDAFGGRINPETLRRQERQALGLPF